MREGLNIPSSLPVDHPDNSRRHGRVRCQHVWCSLGEVVDLSASGLSARCRGRPMYRAGEPIVVSIEGLEGPFDVAARVVWVKRTGLFRHEVAVAFLAMSRAARAALTALGRCAANNEIIGPAALQETA